MFALEVEYLMQRVVASAHNDRTEVEWPPHPSRLFSALVAAYEECDLGHDARAALEWLESLPGPAIHANPPEHGGEVRDSFGVFVPVNDSSELPEHRPRQPRWFPAYTPWDYRVWFIWDAPHSPSHVGPLQRIAENVTYLGHSMSPVRVQVKDSAPEPTLIPKRDGTIMLRTPGKGRLQHLEETHQLRQTNATIKPRLGRITRYGLSTDSSISKPASVFHHPLIFMRVDGPKLPSSSVRRLSQIVRKAVLDLYPDPIPEVVSGHASNGKPSEYPHLAVTPLSDVGHRHADGHVMGFALWLPSNISAEVLDTVEGALNNLDTVTLGDYGLWKVRRVSAEQSNRVPLALRQITYNPVHGLWASVTPVVFGKFPKRSKTGPGKDGGKVIAEMCGLIGLPKPVEARLAPVSVFNGAPSVFECLPPTRFAHSYKSHIVLRFAEPVKGPLLLGVGRYQGFGLCRPWFSRANES